METLSFSILINSDRPLVWNIMLSAATYRLWSQEFQAGSYFEGSWQEGSEIRFLAPAEHGLVGGMLARVKKNDQYSYISIEHLGLVIGDTVDTTSAEAKKWAPSYENYRFVDRNGQTELIVDIQVLPEYRSVFQAMWPRALARLKVLCEQVACSALANRADYGVIET